MRISLKAETEGVTVQTPCQGFMAAVETIAALTKIKYWGRLHNRDVCNAIDFLRKGVCGEDTEMHIIGAVNNGDRTAFHVSYRGYWILRINVIKGKEHFASVEVRFDSQSGEVIGVTLHRMPPPKQTQW